MVLVGYYSFYDTFEGFAGIKCVIRQFLASQDLIVDMILEWLEFLVEVQTEKKRKSTTKNRNKPKNTEKNNETERYRKFQIWDWVATPPHCVTYLIFKFKFVIKIYLFRRLNRFEFTLVNLQDVKSDKPDSGVTLKAKPKCRPSAAKSCPSVLPLV